MNFAEANECFKAETDIFSPNLKQIAVEEGTWVAHGPASNYETGTIEFSVTATDEYIDLSQTELYLKCTIRKEVDDLTTTIMKESDKVGPVNNFFHSLFDQITLTLNNNPIENSNGSYAYRAYLENLLNYSKNAKETHLHSNLFIKDTPGDMDSVKVTFEAGDEEVKIELSALNLTDAKLNTTTAVKSEKIVKASVLETVNQGLLKRRAKFIGKSVEMTSQLHVDLFNTNRYLINRVPFKLSLQRSKNDFALMGDDKYMVHIDKAILYLRKVKIAPSVMDHHIVTLHSINAKYPIRRVVVKTHIIPKGVDSYRIDNIYTGKMPRRVVIGLVDHSSTNGSRKLNPFNFQHFNLSSLKLLIAGHPNPYREPIEMDFANENYLRGYNTLFKGISGGSYENGHDISYEDFAQGYAIYAFNLTPDQCDSEHQSVPKIGDVEIDLKFGVKTDKNINAIIYMEFDNLIEITDLRQVLTDYK